MKYFSTFTGAGGFEQGLPKEWEVVGFSEIDKYAIQVLKYHFPNVINYGDISKLQYDKLPDFDLLVGGSPCQDVSLAGKRKGINASRSGLFFDYIKLLRAKKPSYFIWENVKGMLSSNRGGDFARVLSEFSEAGYDYQYQVLNAKDFGVPQNRERIFVVGHLRGTSAREVFFKPKSYRINTRECETQIARTLSSQYYKQGQWEQYINELQEITKGHRQGYRVYSTEGIATTLTGQAGGVGAKTGLYAIAWSKSTRERGRIEQRIKQGEFNSLETGNGQSSANFVIHSLYPRSSTTNKGGSGRLSWTDDLSYSLDTGNMQAIERESRIRRLTPLECERLMGWQDQWTKYGIDEKGNKIKISDTQRYKLCGNGVVSNCIRAIIEEIFITKR